MNDRYYILRKGTNTPIYDERFHTYGNNKVSHMTSLIVNSEIKGMEWWIDYRFYMMTHTFLVDIAHRPSSTKTFAYSILGAMGKQYNEFLRELGKDINKPFNLPLCSDPNKMYSVICNDCCQQWISLLNQIQTDQGLSRILELFQNTFFNSFRTMDT